MSSGREKYLGSIQYKRMEVYFYEPTQILNPLAVPFVPGQVYPVEVLVPDSYTSSLNPKACEFVPCTTGNYIAIEEIAAQTKTVCNATDGVISSKDNTESTLAKNDESDYDDDDECSPYIGMFCWN